MDDEVPSLDLKVRTSKHGRLGCLVFIVLITGISTAFVYFEFNPRDRVEISVNKILAGPRFFRIVAESQQGGLKAMDWSP